MYLAECDDWEVEYPVTMQEVLREMIIMEYERHGREGLATRLGCSATNADCLRAGYKKVKNKKTGEVVIQNSFISFEHMEALARADGVSFTEMMKRIVVATSAKEILGLPGRASATSQTEPSARATK